jgi:uncharacterized protein YbcI
MNEPANSVAAGGYRPTPAHPTPPGQSAAEISRTMVQLVRRYTGRGPTKARTTLNTNAALVVLAEVLGPADKRLVESGQAEVVLSMRRTYWEMMRDDAISQVEQILHRSVTSAMMDHDLDNDLAALVFLLEPEPDTGTIHTAETRHQGSEP